MIASFIDQSSEAKGAIIVFHFDIDSGIGKQKITAKLLEASGESIPTRLWLAPPTKMDEQQLMEEGVYNPWYCSALSELLTLLFPRHNRIDTFIFYFHFRGVDYL
jgi:hypothetical protein